MVQGDYWPLGILLLVLGSLFLILGSLLLLLAASGNSESKKVEFEGLLVLGPIVIPLGSWSKHWKVFLALSVALFVLFIILYYMLRG